MRRRATKVLKWVIEALILVILIYVAEPYLPDNQRDLGLIIGLIWGGIIVGIVVISINWERLETWWKRRRGGKV